MPKSETDIGGKAIAQKCHNLSGTGRISPRLGLVDSRLPSFLRRVGKRSSQVSISRFRVNLSTLLAWFLEALDDYDGPTSPI